MSETTGNSTQEYFMLTQENYYKAIEAAIKWKSLAGELLKKLEETRGQWIHSVHKEECLSIIAKAREAGL